MRRILLMIILAGSTAFAAGAPEATITNGTVTARLYLPDPHHGYYRGTRFDWSGVIPSLKVGGQEYFGQWFERYDPKLHDAIQGPVEEFSEVGYEDAKKGEFFLRPGVGVVRRPDDKPYDRFRTYDIINGGLWIIRPEPSRITFVHELKDYSTGYSYRYEKTLRLVGKKPVMVIEHKLKNLGKKPIATQQYNHNFFMMNGQPTGPDASVRFGFDLKPTKAFEGGIAESTRTEVRYRRELNRGESTYAEFEGGAPYDIRLEHKKAGLGAHITGDKPVAKLVYWSIRTTFCPEAYVNLQVPPGKEAKWRYQYEFYALK